MTHEKRQIGPVGSTDGSALYSEFCSTKEKLEDVAKRISAIIGSQNCEGIEEGLSWLRGAKITLREHLITPNVIDVARPGDSATPKEKTL